jgi:dTDP-glucose 4,6-dehydratase
MVTGGAGFIGSNLIKLIHKQHPDWKIVNFDSLTYAGNLLSLTELENNPKYTFIKGDVVDQDSVIKAMEGCWAVLHLAAESHVDRSIEDPGPFLNTNIQGTASMLNAARKVGVQRFVQVSTDEVYGSLELDDPAFDEKHKLQPNSPYSASKTSGDLLAYAYYKTYGLPVLISRCSNNYGPYHFPEKLIPLLISNALQDKAIPVYGDGMQRRDWIYVEDHCLGILAILEKGKPGEVYNLGGNHEIPNLELIKLILKQLGKSEDLITFVKDRAGHDRRYAMDCSKALNDLGWQPMYDFDTAIKMTIEWNVTNKSWLDSVTSGDYMEYYKRQYIDR